jgi:putative SOS response-associated peptidase YedK
MCNLSSFTKNCDAVRQFARTMHDQAGNQPPLPAIYCDRMAQVARINRDGERVIAAMRRGFPSPPNSWQKPTANLRRRRFAGGAA